MYQLKNKKSGKILKTIKEFQEDYFDEDIDLDMCYIEIDVFEDGECIELNYSKKSSCSCCYDDYTVMLDNEYEIVEDLSNSHIPSVKVRPIV